jgi:hypothetical protein
MPKFIPFEEIEALADIEQLAQMLDLKPKGSTTKRCACPVHGGDERTLCISPGVRSRRGSLGVFYCQKAQEGGDRISLVAHCMEMGQQEAALFIQSQFGGETGNSDTRTVHRTSSPSITDRASAPQPTFDPEKFAARLVWHEEVAKLGLTEEDAKRMSVGFHPQQKHVFFPIKNPDGSFSAFIGVKDGRVKMPPQWLASQGNVVKLRRA